jgi:hypothetical protein
MGVDRTDYLVWGVKLDADKIESDDFEAEINGAPDRRFDVIYDGMNGEYAIAGKILARSDPYEGTEFTVVDDELSKLDKYAVLFAVCEAIPIAQMRKFQTFLFSHFH